MRLKQLLNKYVEPSPLNRAGTPQEVLKDLEEIKVNTQTLMLAFDLNEDEARIASEYGFLYNQDLKNKKAKNEQ